MRTKVQRYVQKKARATYKKKEKRKCLVSCLLSPVAVRYVSPLTLAVPEAAQEDSSVHGPLT
jgi:hypothetical protein